MSSEKEWIKAYYDGRNSVWQETGMEWKPSDPELTKHFMQGRRDALAEKALDKDTEWDE